ncbi:MAG TPA: RNA polymerase-associated protein RapA, partial [Gammaproteobacteria bacterium]
DGATITFDRDTALINEDMQFLTWEHPMVTGVTEMILSKELGNTALCAIKHKELPPGILLLEVIYILESMAKELLQVSRYLPLTAIRVVIDMDGKDIGERLTPDAIKQCQIAVPPEVAGKVVKTHKKEIRHLIHNSEILANRRAPAILANAQQHTSELLQGEINRLRALQQVNPNVRGEEIDYFENQYEAIKHALETVAPRLDALRVIVST